MMQGDVSAVTLAASGDLFVGRVRVRGLYIVAAATAGSVVLRDGGASGTVIATITTPAGIGGIYMLLPGEGLLFRTSAYAVITTAASVTAFYG